MSVGTVVPGHGSLPPKNCREGRKTAGVIKYVLSLLFLIQFLHPFRITLQSRVVLVVGVRVTRLLRDIQSNRDKWCTNGESP